MCRSVVPEGGQLKRGMCESLSLCDLGHNRFKKKRSPLLFIMQL